MDFSSIMLVLYDCPTFFERLVGSTCYLSDKEELIVHAMIVGVLFLVLGFLLYVLRYRRLSKNEN
jgi:hypothetical protein